MRPIKPVVSRVVDRPLVGHRDAPDLVDHAGEAREVDCCVVVDRDADQVPELVDERRERTVGKLLRMIARPGHQRVDLAREGSPVVQREVRDVTRHAQHDDRVIHRVDADDQQGVRQCVIAACRGIDARQQDVDPRLGGFWGSHRGRHEVIRWRDRGVRGCPGCGGRRAVLDIPDEDAGAGVVHVVREPGAHAVGHDDHGQEYAGQRHCRDPEAGLPARHERDVRHRDHAPGAGQQQQHQDVHGT